MLRRQLSGIGKRPRQYPGMDHRIAPRMVRLLSYLVAVVLVHALAMIALEDLPPRQAIWLTLTTLTTVGFGDLSPATAGGQFITILLLYITGITLLTLVVSDYLDYRFHRRERIRAGQWVWKMKDHVLFINAPKRGAEDYFRRVIAQMRAESDYRHCAVQILADNFREGLPPSLQELGVVHFTGYGNDLEDLKRVNVQQARHIIILAQDEYDPHSDSFTFDVLHRLMEYRLADKAIVECVRDENRSRLRGLGAQTIVRPVRSYPEIMVRAVMAPGAERVLEDLFTHEYDHPERYEVDIRHARWADCVCRLMQRGLGTAMAYISRSGEVICNPTADTRIDATGLIILVKTDDVPTRDEVLQALAEVSAGAA